MAGDCKNQEMFGQKFFGGKIKMNVIDSTSFIVKYLTDIENWCEAFGERLVTKFPYLVYAG